MKYTKYIISILTCCLFFQMGISQTPRGFVSVENGEFKLNRKAWYPVVMNYAISFRKDTTNNSFWTVPYMDYGWTDNIECTGEVDCHETIRADMQLLEDMGFDAIRLVNASCNIIDDSLSEQLYFQAYKKNNTWNSTINIPFEGNEDVYFELISEIIDVVTERGLKIIFLTRGPFDGETEREYYIDTLLATFKNNSTIFAYDFFNEPLYSEEWKALGLTTKQDACDVVTQWKSLMTQNAPNQLLTIGYKNSNEVMQWDPNFLAVDFASFHPYPYFDENFVPYDGFENVLNELYYFGKYINKPWIIGETGLAADDITVTYQQQKDFAGISLKRTKDCGGSGYSWWQYQDIHWQDDSVDYTNNYKGLLNRDSVYTPTGDTSLPKEVQGEPKPAAQEFVDFNPSVQPEDCPCLSSFYNYKGYNKYIITGRLINGNTPHQPIAGGVISGKDYNWKNPVRTFTRPDGTFNLYSDTIIEKLYASAPGWTKIHEMSISWDGDDINVSDGYLGIGKSRDERTSGRITASNFIVKGNGLSGGELPLYAGKGIKFNTGFEVEKGGVLKAEPKNDIGDIEVDTLICSSSEKSANLLSDENTNSQSANADEVQESTISIFPNPTKGVINIVSSVSIIESISIYNRDGQHIYSKTNAPGSHQIDISNQAKGMYFIVVYSNNKNNSKKFILE